MSGGTLNVIPTSRIDPVANNLLALLPQADTGGIGSVVNNYVNNIHESFNQWQVDTRGDVNISEKDKVFARYSVFISNLSNPGVFGVVAGGAHRAFAGSGDRPTLPTSRVELDSHFRRHAAQRQGWE